MKKQRNRELIKLRNIDPAYWTFVRLANRYDMTPQAARVIYHRGIPKLTAREKLNQITKIIEG